jgi:hypothetical protein
LALGISRLLARDPLKLTFVLVFPILGHQRPLLLKYPE